MKKSLGKKDIETLMGIAKEINRLASLKTANFSFNEKTDEDIKRSISPYMTWFQICADDIENIVNGNDTTKRFY